MGYSAWLEFTGHTEGEGVTSGLTGTLSHHEGSFRLLAQYLQCYLPEITVAPPRINDKWTGVLDFFSPKEQKPDNCIARADPRIYFVALRRLKLENCCRSI